MKQDRLLPRIVRVVPTMKNKKEKIGEEKKAKWVIATASRNAPLKSRPKQDTKKTEETLD